MLKTDLFISISAQEVRQQNLCYNCHSIFVLLATFSLQGFTSDLIENAGGEIVLFVQCEFATGSFTIGCLIVVDVYGSSSLNHTIFKQEETDLAMGNISIPITSGGVVIQLTAYSVTANGSIIQNVLPLSQLISVPPILVTSQVVLPTPSPSVIASVTSSATTSDTSSATTSECLAMI